MSRLSGMILLMRNRLTLLSQSHYLTEIIFLLTESIEFEHCYNLFEHRNNFFEHCSNEAKTVL